jgi:hypothetical protein
MKDAIKNPVYLAEAILGIKMRTIAILIFLISYYLANCFLSSFTKKLFMLKA